MNAKTIPKRIQKRVCFKFASSQAKLAQNTTTTISDPTTVTVTTITITDYP